MESLSIRTRLHVQPPGEEVRPIDLEVTGPALYQGPRPSGALVDAPLYECFIRFPGVIPDGFVRRNYSTLETLLGALSSAEAFCYEFQKKGGKFYRAMADDENCPDLSEPIRLKDFFRL
jgi:hypothetical protein